MFEQRVVKWAVTAAIVLNLAQAPAQPPPAPATPPAPPAPPAAAWPEARAYKMFSFAGPGSYLGVGVREITAERAKELKLKDEAGVEVTKVDANSPAEKAGLKPEDAVLEYQGNRVEGTEQFVRLVRETPVGRQVKLKVVRAGAAHTLTAAIADRQAAFPGISKADRERFEKEMSRVKEKLKTLPEIRMPDVPRAHLGWTSGMLGIDGEAIEDQLAEFFGVKEGVLVRSVGKDMPAAKAGMRAGDVVTKIEDTRVSSPREITSAIRSAKNRKPLKVTISRQKTEMTLDVMIEQEPEPRPARRAITVTDRQDFEF